MRFTLATGALVIWSLSTIAAAQVSPLPLPPASTAKPDMSKAIPAPLPPIPVAPAQAAPLAQPTPPVAVAKPTSIEPLPQVATPAEHSSMLSGLNMPGTAAALLSGNTDSLPDLRSVRRYIFSVYAGMAASCGPHGQDGSLAAMGYVEPGLGPGRDAAEAGLQKGLEFLLRLGEFQKSGDATAFARAESKAAYKVEEGEADGAVLSARIGCQDQRYFSLVRNIERLMQSKAGSNFLPDDSVVLASLMSSAYRAKHGIEDPEVTLRKRRIAKSTEQASKQCTADYDSRTFCGCLFGKLQSHTLSEADWSSMGERFGAIVKIASKQPDVAQSIRTCARES